MDGIAKQTLDNLVFATLDPIDLHIDLNLDSTERSGDGRLLGWAVDLNGQANQSLRAHQPQTA